MYAIKDSEGKLVWTVADRPELGPDSLRIKVKASAVNRADLVQRSGHYPPPPGASEILGLECAGEVLEVGERVTSARVGDQVCALLSGGGYAEEVVVPAGQVLPLPKDFDFVRAAAVPEVFTTAWLNLRREGRLKQGERVLVHAGMSGVGTAAVQLCLAWGNPVVVTVGSDEKCERALSLGASGAVNRKEGPWSKKACEGGKFDVILDPVGGSYLEPNIFALNPGGRLVNIGLMGGREGTLRMAPLLTKRLSVVGSVLRSRSVEEKADILRGVRDEVWPLLESGQVRPIIHTVLPIEEAQKAHELVQSNTTVGKVVLRVD